MKFRINKMFFLMLVVSICIISCTEEGRFKTEGGNTTPPGVPTLDPARPWIPLYGGARIYYIIPGDEDLLSVDAEYFNERGERFFFSSSFFKDSIDVIGFGAESEYTVYLYGVNRAGVKSEKIPVRVTPNEPAISRVLSTVEILAGFNSLIVDWKNELEQIINIFVDYRYIQNGMERTITQVFSSNMEVDRRFINNVFTLPTDPVHVSYRVADFYGNVSETVTLEPLLLMEDQEIPKFTLQPGDLMVIPEANDSTVLLRNGTRVNTGIPAFFGDHLEGRRYKLIDGILDEGENLNFYHTGELGRTGVTGQGNMPYNIIIYLGGTWELSRIITHQRHSGGHNSANRGHFYRNENVGRFRLYYFDEDPEVMDWVPTTPEDQRTPVPLGISELELILMGKAGDMSYFYPERPQYTKPTRWFRYEAVAGFVDDYTSNRGNCMSEMTLFGRRVDR